MNKVTVSKTVTKLLIVATIAVLIIAAVSVSTQTGGGEEALNETIEGGELALTSVNRNHESLTQFVQKDEGQAGQLLEAARSALENAEMKLDSVSGTKDEYVLGMLDNYLRVAQASDVMAEGVDNLLFISENLTNVIKYYSQQDYEKTSEQASYCLQILTPLLSFFETSNKSLDGINVFYVPSGQRDRLTIAVSQYRNEMEIYNQYVLFLQSLLEGKDYLQKNAMLEEYLKQLQSAVSNQDYQTGQELLEKISDILRSLRGQEYQDAANLASELDPSVLGDTASQVAQEIQNKLRNLQGVSGFENYQKSLEKYLEALQHFGRGEINEAEQDISAGLGILGQGQAGDQELQGLYAGLTYAFNTLQLRIKGQPDQG